MNDFSIINSIKGVNALIINNAFNHDMNNALFTDTFYKELNKNNKLIPAFSKAKSSIRNSSEYKHPAYWAGIRLYLNGL